MRRALFGILAVSLLAPNAVGETKTVALRTTHSGQYIRAGVGSESYLAAASPHIKAWEEFRLIELGGDEVALQSKLNGKYVRAGVGSESYLAAVSPHIAGWEKFRLVKLGGKEVALRSSLSGQYVRAGVGQISQLAAVSPHIKAWETFELLELGVKQGGPVGPGIPVSPVNPPPQQFGPDWVAGQWQSNFGTVNLWVTGKTPEGYVRYAGTLTYNDGQTARIYDAILSGPPTYHQLSYKWHHSLFAYGEGVMYRKGPKSLSGPFGNHADKSGGTFTLWR